MKTIQGLATTVEWLCDGQLHEVAAIERASFGGEAMDRRRINALHADRSMAGVVAVYPKAWGAGKVVGYAFLRRLPRAVVLERFATDPAYRRIGVAMQLVAASLVQARCWGTPRVLALVPDHNLPCHMMLKRCGFVAAVASPDTYQFTWQSEV